MITSANLANVHNFLISLLTLSPIKGSLVSVHGAADHRIDSSRRIQLAISRPASAQQLVQQRPCICYSVCGMVHINDHLC